MKWIPVPLRMRGTVSGKCTSFVQQMGCILFAEYRFYEVPTHSQREKVLFCSEQAVDKIGKCLSIIEICDVINIVIRFNTLVDIVE